MKKSLKVVMIALVVFCGGLALMKGFDIEFHQCSYYTVCDDNCKENGYSALFLDKNNETYVFDMKDSKEDLSNKKFIVITRGGNKNIVGYLSTKDSDNFKRKPHYIDNSIFR